VALKALHSEQRLDGEARERLLREARALSKLDHPNICRIFDYIESGDVDVLVLEYIEGYTLHEALDNGLSHAEKMRIANAVAQVLVAAHRVGIIHRDLKPDNVMLTRSGEVKVLDFGLARWLTAQSGRRRTMSSVDQAHLHVKEALIDQWYAMEDPETTSVLSADEPNRRDAKRHFMVTAAGVTMGTPLYMSPEQARGETLTTASDMYSFGLMLQTLFTGTEPYPAESTAREVMIRASRGDSLPVSGVPRDVAALIARLKMIAPSDRPTAVETLDRLQWIANTPKRMVRYSAITLIVLLAIIGGWRYTVDLRHERAAAEEARKEADVRRAQAEDLINYMVGDLRTKLEPVGRLDVLDDVARKTLVYINDVQPERMSPGELARQAKALSQLGEVRLAQGDTPAALPLFRKSRDLAQLAARRDPKSAEARLANGQSEFWLGHALWLEARVPAALRHMREYLRISEALATQYPDKREYQLERAYGHSSVGMMLEAEGDLAGALEHYRTSLSIKQSQVDANPMDLKAQAELARAINKVGSVLYQRGQLHAARTHCEGEVAVYRLLVSREPKQIQWKQRLATSMAYLARAMADTGQTDTALDLWQEELRIEEELMAYDPENVERQRNVAVTMRRVAGVHALRGELPRALTLFRNAQTTLRTARTKAPTQLFLQVDLGALDIEYARSLAAAGETARARQMLQAVVRSMEESAASNKSARNVLVRALYFLGEVHEREGRASDAAAAWSRAASEIAPAVKNASDPQILDLWTRILVRQSRLLEAKEVRARLEGSGYAPADLQSFCSRKGC
ncbi:MAG TPA: protein kinase, partial [Thermoanaerobaculia bacterium]